MATAHQEFASDRIMVMSAPSGARRTGADHPAIPVTAGQLADCAQSLLDVSAAVLHLHVRDRDGRHSLGAGLYREAIAAIHARVGDQVLIQATTEAVGIYSPDQQMAMVRELRPEAVSLALSELCPDEASEIDAGNFFHWLADENIWPQYILYSAADVARFDRLRRKGLFAEERPFCLFVLGRYAEQQLGEVADLDVMLAAADCNDFPWAVCCFGAHENAVMKVAAVKGGHVRIGFENNLQLADGSIAADNAELITQFTSGLDERRPATADDIRQSFSMRT